MSRGNQPSEYRIPHTARLRHRLLWRLRRMRGAVDVETLEVFEHELAAFERAGAADLERQRVRNVAACANRLAEAHAREELIRSAITRTEADLQHAEEEAARLEAKLHGRDPELHSYA